MKESTLRAEAPGAARSSWTPRAPVRGTQNFVGTMSAVWRRPGLTLLEVLWRWAVGVPLLGLVVFQVRRLWPTVALDTAALPGMTVFRPLEAFQILEATAKALVPVLWPTARWLVPVLLAVWTLAWAWGRTAVLRRLDPRLQMNFGALSAVRALRTLMLLLGLLLWGVGLRWAALLTVAAPGTRGEDPNLVGFCAFAICGSLLLYVGWAAVNWVLDAAPLLAMRTGERAFSALKAALRLRKPRGKLVEINMVMSIVKIALLVLALVFSACPLPFESIASTGFLLNWWIGVAILYCLFSDYFHVVRSAAYLDLFREGSADSGSH